MNQLPLHELHQSLGAHFGQLSGAELVADYGDVAAEYAALRDTAGVLDLSFRGRICLTGADRVRFLHGQVTNDVKKLRAGQGCYAALVTAKGKMESDLNVWCLQDELLLDFEPGLTQKISQRLEKYIVADDVQIVDVAPHYGLLSVQGPKAAEVLAALDLIDADSLRRLAADQQVGPTFVKVSEAMLGEIYVMNQARLAPVAAGILPAGGPGVSPGGGSGDSSERVAGLNADPGGKMPAATVLGFDLFVPTDSLGAVADKLIAAAKQLGGRAAGWTAFEIARIEAGIPRFGADMDETNIPLECGIEARAVSYSKGCYIGQEVINRIHSIGHVNRALRALRPATGATGAEPLPQKGDKLFHDGKEVGYVTSAVKSPALNATVVLGYVRREANQIGTELMVRTSTGESMGLTVSEIAAGK